MEYSFFFFFGFSPICTVYHCLNVHMSLNGPTRNHAWGMHITTLAYYVAINARVVVRQMYSLIGSKWQTILADNILKKVCEIYNKLFHVN